MVRLRQPVTMYKKAKTVKLRACDDGRARYDEVLVELLVPRGALSRADPATVYMYDDPRTKYPKNRVSSARVVSLTNLRTGRKERTARPAVRKNSALRYRVGSLIRPEQPFDKSDTVCAPGIHGFFSKDTAIDYQI